MKKLIGLIFAALFLTGGATAQDHLPRQGFIGAQIENLSAETRARLKLAADARGVVVRAAVAGGSAEAAGLKADDVVLELNGVEVADVARFVAIVRRLRAGDRLKLKLRRDGAVLETEPAVKPKPPESSPSFEVLYRAVTVDGARRRVIITKPKAAGRHPALLFLAGVGCYSQDNLPEGDVHRRIFYHLTERRDFVTMRVEKSGAGDSEGPSCDDPAVDFATEVKGYLAGLEFLKTADFVDAERIFLFGHSMGGVIAPLVAAAHPVRGIVVTGTVGKSWFEYELENLRRQRALRGAPYDETEALIRQIETCNYRLYRLKETPAQAGRDSPACLDYSRGLPAPYTYMRQVAELNLAEKWKQTTAPVLAVYGASDFLTSAAEHLYLVEMLNKNRAGRARYLEIPQMTHGLRAVDSPAEAIRRQQNNEPEGEFKEEFLTAMDGWLAEQMKIPDSKLQIPN